MALVLFFYFIEQIAEQIVSYFLGYRFFYTEQPFLKLIYILLFVVTLGVFSGIHRKQDLPDKEKQQLTSSYLLSILVATLVGFLLHLYFVYQEMITVGSLKELENDVFRYFITDYFLVIGFVFAGLKVRKYIH
jgi:membrane protease YdiL (CAAX protease family)